MTDQENQINNHNSPAQRDPEQVQKPDVGSSPNQEKQNEDPPLQDKTASQQESDMLKEREKITKEQANKSRSEESGTPISIIFDCLYQSFNHESIRVFCQCYFKHLYKELREFDQFKTVIRQLIDHCEERRETDNLWLRIEKENINQYKIYYPQWKKAILDNQKSQRRFEDKRSSDSINQFINEPSSIKREKPPFSDSENQNHPLSGNNRVAINDWFYKELEKLYKNQ